MPEALRTPGNAYLKSPLFESAFLAPDRNAAAAATSLIETQQPQYFRPYAVAQIADSRITGAEFSHWTSVCTDDKLVRALLHVYLLTDYQTFSFFHKDFFLDDLNSRRPRFCSSLLVHAILAHACLIHLPFPDRVEYWNPQSLGYKFFAEARRLWDMDRLEPDSVTTIQAGMIMNIIYNVYSMDKVGLSYGAQASAMAYKMGLFKLPDEVTDPSLQIVRDFTAWGLVLWHQFPVLSSHDTFAVAIRTGRTPSRPGHQSGMVRRISSAVPFESKNDSHELSSLGQVQIRYLVYIASGRRGAFQ